MYPVLEQVPELQGTPYLDPISHVMDRSSWNRKRGFCGQTTRFWRAAVTVCMTRGRRFVLTKQLAPSFALLPSFGKMLLLREVGTINRNSYLQAVQLRMPSTLLQESVASRDNLAMPSPPGHQACKSSRKSNPR